MNKKSASRRPHRQAQHRLKPVYAAVLLAFSVQTSQANPIGGSVVNGSASFATAGNTLTVTNTPGTIINWQSFSINSNEITNFAQQSASSTVLNRVTGNDPSNIMGKLQSNGRVFLINPHGILFGAGAVVDVAGLVASTLNLSNADFLAGKNHFTEVPGAANISNAGSITAQHRGQIYLIAPNVENTGVITAPNGEILLAAGYSVDLVSTDNPNLRVNITAPAGNATNIGQLIASSGSLGLFGTVVSNSGIVNADSATMQGGKIVFKASQSTEISGTVSANGTTGGNIEVLGNQVGVLDGASVSANGAHGGGTVLIGGDAHGANPDVQNAQLTYVAPTATISADATQSGNGGKVVVWSDQATQFGGNISARGGAVSGNGGWVEVSGKQWLGYAGLVNTTAAHGEVGSLLLDPTDITISTAPDSNLTIGTAVGGIFSDATSTPSNLNVTTLTDELVLSNVTVNSNSVLAGTTGDITVLNPISWSSDTSLTLYAAGAINVNANITNTSVGGLSLQTVGSNITIGGNISLKSGAFDVNAYGGAISMTGALNVGSFKLVSGTWKQVSATLPVFNVSNDFNIAGGTFIRALGGDGIKTPYQLADIYGVEGINSGLGLSYVLANDIDASVTQNWLDVQGAPVGFTPIGYNVDQAFSGKFDGQNHTISNLYINGGIDVGLFGNVIGGTISNVGLVNAIVTGATNVGGLVGSDSSGDISNSYVKDSTVSGASSVGGLVGYNQGSNISASHVSGGTVSGSGNNVGGLVGNYFNSVGGTISNSYVDLGTKVTGLSYVGGLVGNSQYGSIRGSHVDTVTVTGSGSGVGGLVGYNHSSADGGSGISITNSYVNNGTVIGAASVGGLVGYNSGGNISASHVSGGTVTGASSVGGLVGYNASAFTYLGRVWGLISASYVSGGVVTAAGSDVGGLVGTNAGNVSGSYVNGVTVISNINDSSANAGGLVGNNSGTISNSYASNGIVKHGSAGSGSATGAHNFGGLVGINSGTINTSYVSNGSVTGSGSGAYNFGGLVGDNSGTIDASYTNNGTVKAYGEVGGLAGNNSGSISNSYASGSTITGTSNNVGGLAGNNNGTIDTSFASNNNVSGAFTVGGLVGYNAGNINNTYASGGTVSASDYVGGLVGSNIGNIGTSYASVAVLSNGSYGGGFVGVNYGGPASISASFWNTTVAGVSSGIGFDPASYGGAVGMSDADMKTMANFTSATAANGNVNPGWDFTTGTVWHMTDGLSMPLLPFSPETIVVPNVIGEIVNTVNQNEKPKPVELVVADDTPGVATQSLPMCN